MQDDETSTVAAARAEVHWGTPSRPSPPVDEERAEDAFDLPFGAVVHAADGHAWAFVGWRENSAGRNAWFVREQTPRETREPIAYSAAHAATLERKFPDVAGLRRKRRDPKETTAPTE
jgi:hypothetical protein